MTPDERDHISRGEIRKDAAQDALQAGIHTVEQVATIITRAVGDIARAAGNLGTELFEIRDASRKAQQDHGATGDVTEEGPDGAGPS